MAVVMTKRRAWVIARIVLLIGFITALWWAVDWGQLANVAASLSPLTIVGILLCGSSARMVGTIRWNVLCHGLIAEPPTIPRMFRLGLLAEFVNIWVPSFIGGEVVRIWGVREYSDTATATWSVVIDRVLGLAGLILAVVPLAVLIDLPIPPWAYGVGALAVAAGVAFAFAIRPRLLRLGGWAEALARLSVPRVLGALALSTTAPWCLVLGYTLFFGDVHPLPTASVAAFILLSRFGRAVPVQLFGVNSVEGSMWILGELLGIPREILALSMAMNVSDKYVHSMIGGLVELGMNGTTLLRRLMDDNEV